MPTDPIILPLSEMSGADSPHVSPTLARLTSKDRPSPFPACGTCPRSNWLVVATGLKCYCTAYHRISWQTPLDPSWGPVLACDAREMAIEELKKHLTATR